MCAAKSPKITTVEKEAPKPIIIRNPYLDGDPAYAAARKGRSGLRVDLGSTRKPVTNPTRQPSVPSPYIPQMPWGPGGPLAGGRKSPWEVARATSSK